MNNLSDTPNQDYSDVIFQGLVVANNDPERLERIKVSVKGLYEGSNLPWCMPYKHRLFGSKQGGQGVFAVPTVGSRVYVILQQGSPEHPMYSGSLLAKGATHATFTTNYPNRYGLIDPAGNIIFVDTTPGQVQMHLAHVSGTTLHIAPNGAVTINTPTTLDISAGGNVTISSGTHIGLAAPRIDLN